MSKETTFAALAGKGDGILIKRGTVWTYPAAEIDRSGTNVQLPLEYVTDAEVQEALRGGELHPATTGPGGDVLSVRLSDGDVKAAISVAQAGTPEAGTELPPNSRPSHDAGMKSMSAADAERLAHAQTKVQKAEGSEVRPGTSAHKGR
jgi:hypothetical protein